MDEKESSFHYNEAIILSELERRFYLYLIGGDYEKLFYTFEESHEDDTEHDVDEQVNMSRIRLEVEVTQQQRQILVRSNCADPEYKGILDYMLKSRINNQLENQEDILKTCPQLVDITPILKRFGKDIEFNETLFQEIEAVPWLTAQIKRFVNNPDYDQLVDLPDKTNVRNILTSLGYSLFIWLLPRFVSETLHANMHHSLRPLVARMRQFGRFTSGAIATLIQQEPGSAKDKWMTYMLASINIIPLFLLVNLVNSEIKKLLDEQLASLENDKATNADKLAVIEHYQFSSDTLRDFLCLEEILKPHILEDIGFENFDPLPYLLGYADDQTPLADVFFRARAYAFYRQLFKTGRIQPHETAVFLRKHHIDKCTLHQLNEFDLASIVSHIKLHKELIHRT